MSKLLQSSFTVDAVPEAFKSPFIFETDAHPFVNGHQSLSVVNQHGKIKIFGLVDAKQPSRPVRFLIIGTGHKVPKGIGDRLRLVGPVMLSDGQYGQHVYYIDDYAEEDRAVAPSRFNATSIGFGLGLSSQKAGLGVLTFVHEVCNRHRGRIQYEADRNDISAFKVIIIDSSFREEPDYEALLSSLYDEPIVEWVRVSKVG